MYYEYNNLWVTSSYKCQFVDIWSIIYDKLCVKTRTTITNNIKALQGTWNIYINMTLVYDPHYNCGGIPHIVFHLHIHS